MKATMQSTSKTVILNGMNFRVWEGISEKGLPFVALVNRLQSGSQEKLVQELQAKHKEPEPETAAILEALGVV